MTSRVPTFSPGGYVRILLDLVMWLAVERPLIGSIDVASIFKL